MDKLSEFKKELKQLLEKYDAVIYWECGEGSDLWGIYGETMKVSIGKDEYTLTEDGGISKEDL